MNIHLSQLIIAAIKIIIFITFASIALKVKITLQFIILAE